MKGRSAASKDRLLGRIGVEIRRIRESVGESQQDMADALGITTVHLSNLENGKNLPSLKLLTEIRRLYGLDAYVLAALNGGGQVTLLMAWNEEQIRKEPIGANTD